jgi:polygalacturonase
MLRSLLLLFLIAGQLIAFGQKKEYLITSYGASGDGITNNASFIQKAIDKATASGGGKVVIPAGKFLSGIIQLKSGVELHLNAGAVLLASAKRSDYGAEKAYPFISATNQQNISITGKGTIDGQARELMKDVFKMLNEGTLQDEEWKVKRPGEKNRPLLLVMKGCKNVRVTKVTLKDAANWVQRFDNCTNLTIDSITVESVAYWNNDGIDIVDSKNVKITNSKINASDDGICLKSEDPESRCENVYVANCRIRSSASAFKLGTGSAGGFRKIKVRDLYVYDTYRSAIALECVDGGVLEDIDIRNVTARNTGNALFIRLGHRHNAKKPGQLHKVYIANVHVEVPLQKPDKGYETEGPPVKEQPQNKAPSSITGLPGEYVDDVTLENIEIVFAGGARKEVAFLSLDSLKVPERPAQYPEFTMFGELPAWGFYVRHASNIKMKNIRLIYMEEDYRPAFVFDDCAQVKMNDVTINSGKELPFILLHNVNYSTLKNIVLPSADKKGIRYQYIDNPTDSKQE